MGTVPIIPIILDPGFPFVNETSEWNPFEYVNGVWRYTWLVGEGVSSLNGIPGQGNPNPLSLFENHLVVLVGNPYGAHAIYDASYGVTYNDATQIDDAALAGHGYYEMWNPAPGGFYRLHFRRNPAGDNIRFFIP